jgi:hypothetical protein
MMAVRPVQSCCLEDSRPTSLDDQRRRSERGPYEEKWCANGAARARQRKKSRQMLAPAVMGGIFSSIWIEVSEIYGGPI